VNPPDGIAIEPPVDGTKAGCTVSSPLSLSTTAASTLSAHLIIPSSPSSPHSLSGVVTAPMANFAIDLETYIPPAMGLEDRGPHHRARTTVYIRGGDNKTHESYAIAHDNEEITVGQRLHLFHDITHYFSVEVRQLVRSFAIHPHGIGIFKLKNACERDTLVALSLHFIGPRQISFVPHDEAPMNFRSCTFTRKCWVLLLGYLLDLKKSPIITQVYAPFVNVLHRNNEDTSISRVLLKILVEDILDIPRSLVIKLGRELNGDG
jgi:hypothetical protein